MYTFTGVCFFCRVWFNASSTGFTESEIHFAMNRQEVFLPFEEDVWEKEVLPSPGCRGAYLSDPQRAPLMPPTPPTPPQHCLTRAGLSFLCVGFTVLHLPSRSTAWPSLLSYLMCYLCFLGIILSHPPFLWRAGSEGAAGACSSASQRVHIPLAHHMLWQWDTWGALWEVRTLA